MTQFNETDIVLASFAYSLVLVIGTSGNLILMISILFRREARRMQSNVFLISLALTDFLTSTICGPYYLRSLHVSEFMPNDGKELWLCSVMLVYVYFFAIESILSLALLSLDRFFAVRMPFWYQRMVTRRSCVGVTCFCWIYGMVTLFPAFFDSDWVVYENQPGSPCGFRWGEASEVFIGLNFLFSFVIPAIVICVTNVLVFKTAKEQNRKVNICPADRRSIALSGANRAFSEPRESRAFSAADVSKHELVGQVSGNSTNAVPSGKILNQTTPSRLIVHSVSAISSRTTINVASSGSTEHRMIKSLSLNNVDSLQTQNFNSKLPCASSSSTEDRTIRSLSLNNIDSLQTQNFNSKLPRASSSSTENRMIRSLSLNNVDTPQMQNFNLKVSRALSQPENVKAECTHLSVERITETDISSVTKHANQPYHSSENRIGVDLRKPKGDIEKAKVKPFLKSKNEGSSSGRGNISPKKEIKLVLATISISAAFFISWMPFVIPRVMVLVSETNVSDRVLNYGIIFSVMSSAWNPYIILLTRKELLLGFKKVVRQLENKIFSGRS